MLAEVVSLSCLRVTWLLPPACLSGLLQSLFTNLLPTFPHYPASIFHHSSDDQASLSLLCQQDALRLGQRPVRSLPYLPSSFQNSAPD